MALYGRILKGAVPGKALSQFHSEALEEIERSDMGFSPRYGMGGGIGLSLAESPEIIGSATGHIADCMSLTFRLNLKTKEKGDFMMGDTILISKGGAEVLSNEMNL